MRNRFEIIERLGSGSSGIVYKCKHRELSGQVVALKVLFEELAADDDAMFRFRNEIVSGYAITHQNVVRPMEYIRDGDFVAYSMEYMDGGNLAEKMAELPVRNIDSSVELICDIARGLQAIHDAGMLHNNLKPENILFDASGNLKIADFGFARFIGVPDPAKYEVTSATIDYVAPEYLELGKYDTRSDIYGIGVLAYELITGQIPFTGKSVVEAMTKRLTEAPVPPLELAKGCSQLLSDTILKALARNPDERFQTAKEFCEELEKIRFQRVLH